MKTPLVRRVLDAIRRGRMIAPGDRVAVGVSGGADSVALLRLLAGLRGELGITLLVAHFDHALRGGASDADAEFVAALARQGGLELICERADVAAAAAERRLNLEDAARRLRYAFFQRIADQGRATRVAVAHTADDQAETVLARLLRGTGPAGLAAIQPVLGVVVRPLLMVRREELRDHLRSLGQSWREDLTNFDVRRQRAQIRTQLLPVLEKDFSPRIVSHFGELARFCREEQKFWGTLVENRMRALVEESAGRFRIPVFNLLFPLSSPLGDSESGNRATALWLGPANERSFTHPPLTERPLTERLIRRLYERVRGSRHDLGAVHVEQVIHLTSELAGGGRVELPGGVVAERSFGNLVFYQERSPARARKVPAETQNRKAAYHYVVDLPPNGATAISIPELGICFLLKVIDWSSTQRETSREDTLDAELLHSTLTLRNWHPGDAYRPRGHRQVRKLKQMFVARRIPRGLRAQWPVIECGGKIIWARDMPPAGDFCAGERTKVGLLIEEGARK